MYPSACELNPLHKQRRCFATSGSSTLRPPPGTHGCSCSCSDSGSGATFLHYPGCRGPQQTAYAPLLYTRWEVSLFEHAKVVLLLGEVKGERCHRCKRRAAADVALRPCMHAPLSQCSRLVPPSPQSPYPSVSAATSSRQHQRLEACSKCSAWWARGVQKCQCRPLRRMPPWRAIAAMFTSQWRVLHLLPLPSSFTSAPLPPQLLPPPSLLKSTYPLPPPATLSYSPLSPSLYRPHLHACFAAPPFHTLG